LGIARALVIFYGYYFVHFIEGTAVQNVETIYICAETRMFFPKHT